MSDFEELLAKKRGATAAGPSFEELLAKKRQVEAVGDVGPGETFLNHTANIVPAGRPVVDTLTATGLQALKALGVGKPGARLTPQARAEIQAQGGQVAPEDANAIPGPLESYRRARDMRKARTEAGSEQNPWASGLGTAAGIGLTALSPLPKVNVGGKAASAAATGAGYGTVAGLTDGEADLTRGEFGKAGREALAGGAVGAAGGAALQKLASGAGKFVGAVRKRAGKGIQEAVDQETAKQTALAEKAINSKQGEYRSSVQSASRDLEVMQRESAQLPAGPLRDSIENYLQSAEGLAVREQVAANKLTTAPDRISEMGTKLGEFQTLSANKAANVQAQTGHALSNPWERHYKPRLATLGHRMLPVALAGAGGVLGGAEGAAVGTGLGGVLALVQGRPGIIVRNLMREPASRKVFWEKVLGAVGGPNPQTSVIAGALQSAAEKGPQEFAKVVTQIGRSGQAGEDVLRAVAEVGEAEDEEDPRAKALRQGRKP